MPEEDRRERTHCILIFWFLVALFSELFYLPTVVLKRTSQVNWILNCKLFVSYAFNFHAIEVVGESCESFQTEWLLFWCSLQMQYISTLDLILDLILQFLNQKESILIAKSRCSIYKAIFSRTCIFTVISFKISHSKSVF